MSSDNKCAVVHMDHRTIPTKYSIVYLYKLLFCVLTDFLTFSGKLPTYIKKR